MKKIEYKFSEREIELLKKYRDKQKDFRLKTRYIALIMLAKGSTIECVASSFGKSKVTITLWLEQYITKGIDSLNSFQYKPKRSYLTSEQIDQVVSWVKETNPGKTKEVREYIKDHFKIVYSNEAVRKLLKKMGLKILRPKVVPGNPPSEEEQKKN